MAWYIRANDGSYFGVDDAVLLDVDETSKEFQHAQENDMIEEYFAEISQDAPEMSDLLRGYIESEGGTI